MKKIIALLAFALILVSACSQVEDEDSIKAKKIIDYHKKKFDALPLSGKIVDGLGGIAAVVRYKIE